MTYPVHIAVRQKRWPWTISLCLAQLLLAAWYGMAGTVKVSRSLYDLQATSIGYANNCPVLFIRFIGTMELLGVLGIFLPMLTGVMRRLTPLAALWLSIIQLSVIAEHVWRGDLTDLMPANLVPLFLSVFVLWGRRSEFPAPSARDTRLERSPAVTRSNEDVDRLDCSNIS